MPKSKNLREKLSNVLCDTFDFPPSVAKSSALEITGREKIVIFECYTIDKYSSEEIKLTMDSHKISITGNCLSMLAYVGGKIEITGELQAIQFHEKGDTCLCD